MRKRFFSLTENEVVKYFLIKAPRGVGLLFVYRFVQREVAKILQQAAD